MDFSDAIKHFGTDRFEDTCIAIMLENSSDLPLESYCLGSWPDPGTEEIEVCLKSSDENTIHIEAKVGFTALQSTSCPDINRAETHLATLEIVIDRKTGDAEITPL